MDEVVTTLTNELRLLNTTLQRNKAQHRRSKFYRALKGGATTLLAELELDHLFKLCISANTAPDPSSVHKDDSTRRIGLRLDAAVVTIANAAFFLKQAARQLKQEIAAGYFISLCLAWLAMTARILELLRALVTSFLKKRRALSMPDRPAELVDGSFLADALEWLLTYGNAPKISSGNQSLNKKRNATTSNDNGAFEDKVFTSSAEVNSEFRRPDDEDDVGEVVAFAPSSSAINSTLPRDQAVAAVSPVPVPQSGQVFLAADYSDSDDNSNDQELSNAPLQARDETSGFGWTLDTGSEDVEPQTIPQASSSAEVRASGPLISNSAASTSFLAEDYSDSDGSEATPSISERQALSSSTKVGALQDQPVNSNPSLLAEDYSDSDDGDRVAPNAIEVPSFIPPAKQGIAPDQTITNKASLLAQDYSDSEDEEDTSRKDLGVTLERTENSNATATQNFERKKSTTAAPSDGVKATQAGHLTKKKKRKLADVPGTSTGDSPARAIAEIF